MKQFISISTEPNNSPIIWSHGILVSKIALAHLAFLSSDWSSQNKNFRLRRVSAAVLCGFFSPANKADEGRRGSAEKQLKAASIVSLARHVVEYIFASYIVLNKVNLFDSHIFLIH